MFCGVSSGAELAKLVDRRTNDRRNNKEQNAKERAESNDGTAGGDGNDVVTSCQFENDQHGKDRATKAGIERLIERQAKHIVRPETKRESLLKKRVEIEDDEQEAGKEDCGEEDFRNQVVPGAKVDSGKEAHGALDPAEIPVGLRAREDGCWTRRAVDPDRIYLHKSAESGHQGEEEKKKAERLERIGGP